MEFFDGISLHDEKNGVRRPGIKPGSGPWQGPILSLNYRRWPQVLPGIEPGFRDSESPVITVTLQDLHWVVLKPKIVAKTGTFPTKK